MAPLASFALLISLAALAVLGCGPTASQAPQSSDGGVIAPALSRPPDVDNYLQLPDDVEPIAFPWSEVTVERAAGALTLGVLVANTNERRQRGMMFRRSLPAQSGMLFVWEQTEPRRGGFWNQNVPIDLDVAWLAADGTITEFTVLIAQDTSVKRPSTPYVFVLEMPRGRFAELAIELGDRVVIPRTLLPP